jgi:hypothetical protein
VQGTSGEFDNVESAVSDADAWITWFFHQCAFAVMIGGFIEYGFGLLSITVTVPEFRGLQIRL